MEMEGWRGPWRVWWGWRRRLFGCVLWVPFSVLKSAFELCLRIQWCNCPPLISAAARSPPRRTLFVAAQKIESSASSARLMSMMAQSVRCDFDVL
jgi:hypothetical protein